MDKTVVLKAEIREQSGSKQSARLRGQGRVPAVVYGHKKDPVAISLDAHDFAEGLHRGQRLIDVQIGKKKEKMMVKDLQYDHLGKEVIHADLMRVDVTEVVKVDVPVEIKGTAKGTHEGGIIEVHADKVQVECKVVEIPESIALSVKELGVGDSLHAKDLQLPEGVKLVSPPEMLIVSCRVVAVAKTTEELEAETPVAPEVITGPKEPKEEQGAEQE
jgi:large subunit ribosomal protein L25